MKNHIKYLLSIALLMTFIESSTYTIEGYSALKNYLNNCISQLFYPNHELREVKNFIQSLADNIHNQEAGWFSLWVDYNQEKVYQLAIGETIEFIAREARRYGSAQASERIKEEITRKIMNYREVPTGALSEYIGHSLRQRVSRIEPAATTLQETHHNIYPSEECCICYNTFDGSVEQIFLVPCGHDLCKECCKTHFFEFNNRTCPKCHCVINKEQLQKALFKRSTIRRSRSRWD